MADWKGILGALMVGGSEGYMAGKQQEWAAEAAQMKSDAAQRLKQMERKQAVEDRDAGFTSAEKIQKLKGSTDVEVANIKAKADTYKADKQYSGTGGSGGKSVSDLKPADLEKLNNMKTEIEEAALSQALSEIDQPGVLSRMKPGDQTKEYEAAVEKRMKEILSQHNIYQQVIKKSGGGNSQVTGSDSVSQVTGGGRMFPDDVVAKKLASTSGNAVPGSAIAQKPQGMIPGAGGDEDVIEPAPIAISEDNPSVIQRYQAAQKPQGMIPAAQNTQRTDVLDPKNKTASAPKLDSKDTNVIMPMLEKLASKEVNLGEILGGIANIIAKVSAPVAKGAAKTSDAIIRETGKALKTRYEGSIVSSMSKPEIEQLQNFIAEMVSRQAISDADAAELSKLLAKGDLKTVANILSSI